MAQNRDFIFSANNLKDYLECPRRFELKYILKQNWPAISSQPVQEMEFRIHQGNRFHQVANQYLSGVPIEILASSINDPDLLLWFTNFHKFIKPYLEYPYYSEFLLTISLEDYRLIAVFDFIAQISDSEILIIDWKTTTRRPKTEFYLQSVQTLLYPLIVFENQNTIFSQENHQKNKMISMAYWFPNFPESTVSLNHIDTNHNSSKKVISTLISEIVEKEPGEFEKTNNNEHCSYCQFRSLCERGIVAGNENENPSDNEDPYGIEKINFDFAAGVEF